MFYPMAFFPSFENQYCVRNLKLSGCKTKEQAIVILQRSKKQGYVKELNKPVPVWSNVK